MSDYIYGIDVSNNSGSIDFSKVANDGVKYVYIKATEGATYQDSTMATFYSDCKSNSLKVGAYHFLVSTSTPEAQAQNFYSMIESYDWDLVPMMDIETNFDGLTDYITRFITEFESLCSLQLGIYTYTSFISYLTDIEDTIKAYPFWEANYNNDPWDLSDTFFTNRIGHQYTESGSVSGVSGNCDLDSFTEGVLLSSSSSASTTTSGEWVSVTSTSSDASITTTKYWYKHDDDTYTESGWEKIDSKWYYFDSEGYMSYGWINPDGQWYWLGSKDTGYARTGWVYANNKWFYLDTTTYQMQTGWYQENSNWYYLTQTADSNYALGQIQTGWIAYGNSKYYARSNGAIVMDTTYAIDGVVYTFDSTGAVK